MLIFTASTSVPRARRGTSNRISWQWWGNQTHSNGHLVWVNLPKRLHCILRRKCCINHEVEILLKYCALDRRLIEKDCSIFCKSELIIHTTQSYSYSRRQIKTFNIFLSPIATPHILGNLPHSDYKVIARSQCVPWLCLVIIWPTAHSYKSPLWLK